MEKDLLIEMRMVEEDEEEDVEEEEEETAETSRDNKKDEIAELREHFESAINTNNSASFATEREEEMRKSSEFLSQEIDKLKLNENVSCKNESLQSLEAKQNSEQYDTVPELTNPYTKTYDDCSFFDDSMSIRSTSSVASIAPEIVKQRVKKNLQKRNNDANKLRRKLIKGEASTATRTRRENRDNIKDNIKEYAGCGNFKVE